MAVSPGARLGPYEVVGLLGAGGMGEVYRARDTRLGREVALKILPSRFAESPARLARLEREARLLAALNHPHIATLYGFEESAGTPALVMELVEGATLAARLERGPLPLEEALELARQIAEALEAAHEKGILHRDLKPANVRLTEKGQVKLLDFGLAKALRPVEEEPAPTHPPSTLTTEESPVSPGTGVAGTAPYMSPEQARGEEVDRRSDLWAFGCVLYEMLTGRRAFPGRTFGETVAAVSEREPDWGALPPGTPSAVMTLLRRCLRKKPDERLRDAGDARLELEELLGQRRGQGRREGEERSPYPGLRAFTEEDTGVFFGREEEVAALWERIRERELLAVIGPSGAGKTSFLQAGVIPARPEGWGAAYVTPGSNPALGVARALVPELAGDPEAIGDLLSGVAELTQAGETRVSWAAKRWRARHAEALLVVDQFEELFTLSPPGAQKRFAALLGRLASEADVHLLLSLRDDFLVRSQEQPALNPVLAGLTVLLPLSSDSLRRALVEPAKKRGYRLEDEGLVDEMVASVEGARTALPLLAFAVSRLWEKRDRERKLLTREAYQEIGGVAGALAQHAEATMDRIGGERQAIVREIFRNLATAHGTRAVVDREELLSVFANRAAAEDVLGQLIDARLLTSYGAEGKEGEPSRHQVEIVHESLLRAWPRLVRWQAQDDEGAVLRDQLKQAAHLWEEKGRTGDLLWRGTAYREFELWRERYPGALTALEEDFARAMADKARRRRRLVMAAVASVMVALGGTAIAIGVSRQQATRARDRAQAEALRAEASKLLALAQLRLGEDPTEALAFTTASLELADTREARAFAMKVLWTAPPAFVLPAGPGARGTDFSRDGRWMAVGGYMPGVRVWREDGRDPTVLQGPAPSAEAPIVTRWAARGLLVTGWSARGREAEVWSLPEGRRVRAIDFGGFSWWQVGRERLFAQTLESGTEERPGAVLLRSWPLPDGEMEVQGRIDRAGERITSIVFEPDGKGWLYSRGRSVYYHPRSAFDGSDRLLARHDSDATLYAMEGDPNQAFSRDPSGEIRLWSFTRGGPALVRTIRKPETAPPVAFPDPSGRWLVSDASEDRQARLWDLGAWPAARPLSLRWSGSWTWAVTRFHPRGEWLVVSPDMSHLVFWPVGRVYPAIVDGCTAGYTGVTFSPDGRWVAANWTDDTVRLWPLPGSDEAQPWSLSLPEGKLWTVPVFDPRLRHLLLLGLRGSVRGFIVPLDGAKLRELEPLPERTLTGSRPAISPSGRLTATAVFWGPGPKILRVWDLETGGRRDFALPVPQQTSADEDGPPSEPTGYEGGVSSLGFVDERTLLTSGDGGIRRWDLAAGANELLVASEPGHTMTMALSADGRTALTFEQPLGPIEQGGRCGRVALVDLAVPASSPLPGFGECGVSLALDPSGAVAATADREGVVRVGRVSGGEPHLLLGHERWIKGVAVSPDRRWVATVGEDKTLRVWPMPDLSKPPLHALPLDALLAKLRSLTNLRAVRDPASSTGWKVELGPFPGWKDVPTW